MIQERKKSWHQQVKELTQIANQLYKENHALKYLYHNSVKINKKNLEYFKERCRLLEDNYIPLEELDDK